MTADAEKSVCLVCNARIGVSRRNNCPIFQLNVESSEQPVANILSVVLGQEIRREIVHSDIVCKKCYKLCNEVDELQERLTEIKMEINNYYQRTLRKLEGGSEDEAETSAMLYVQKPRKPGRPRKNPIVEGTHFMADRDTESRDENGADANESQDMPDEEPEEEEDVLGIGEDDENDEDYIPDKKPGSRLSEENKDDYETDEDEDIDAEEEEEEDTLDDKQLPGVRRKVPKKKEDDEFSTIVPQMIISRNDKIYTCLLCSVDENVHGEAKTMMTHMKDAHNIRLYICDICGSEFLKKTELATHLDEHEATEDGEFECDVCNRIFTNLRLLRVHKRMHFPQQKNHVCDNCGKAFLSRNMLEEHMNTHTGARPYKCKDCSKEFASKYSHRAHMKTHTERPRPYKCTQCGKTFVSQPNLLQHEKTHTSTRNFTCQICGKSFSSGRNLEVHCVIHTGYKPFVCRVCGKAFARKAEIRDHERTHTGEKPYQCEFCGATFGQRSNLQSHKRATHYDDKRYQCIECGKAFKRRRLLDYHIKAAHTGERPYKCQICSATFIYPEHFKKHRRIHTGEKPYLCEVCGKAFNSRDNRNAHRFVHSDKKPYECLVCGLGFMRKPQLYNHMQTQGHVNDTIVVNQPRLTTDDDYILQQEQEEQMEMIISADSSAKWAEQSLEEGENEDTKVYIKELKEHVILQQKDGQAIGEDGQVYTTEEVGHLIIDGQVQFADADSIEIEEGTTITESIDGEHQIVVPASRHGGEFTVEAVEGEDGNATVQTSNGPVHLVISLPDGESNQQNTWFNLVSQ